MSLMVKPKMAVAIANAVTRKSGVELDIESQVLAASAALGALSDAGYAVVPKEATDAEWNAAWETLPSNNWLTLRQHISVHHARTFFQAVRHAMLASAPEVT